MSSVIAGLVLGGVASSAFIGVTCFITNSLLIIALGILSVFGLTYMCVHDASAYTQLDTYFRMGRYGIYQCSTGSKRFGLFWGIKPCPFIAYWVGVPKNSAKYSDAAYMNINEEIHVVAPKSFLLTIFGKTTGVVNPSADYTHEYNYVTIISRCSGFDANIQGNRAIKAKYTRRNAQRDLIDSILSNVRSSPNMSCVCCIYGRPGTGKSTIASIVASEIRGRLTDANVLAYDGALEEYYKTINPTSTNPVVFRFDEIDTVVDDILLKQHLKSIGLPVSKEMPDAISIVRPPPREAKPDFPMKKDWTAFLDRIAEGFYPNAIFIFTTNKDISEYDAKDPALFRNGRFNICRVLNDIE